jgi:hypothetical protein
MTDNDADNEGEKVPDSGREPDKERRRYFRIKEDIILFYSEIAPHDIPNNSCQELPLDPFTLSSTLELLTQESRTLLRRIERDSPDIADFLKVIERKIDAITRTFLTYETGLADQPTHHVSLSASGLSFDADKFYEPGKVLELKMVLLPNLIGVVAYGRVVYCKHNRDKTKPPHHVAVDFVGLSDRDRELLIRHVVKQQLQQLREKKHQPE